MRKLAAVIFGLLILAPHAPAKRAQSVRNRSAPTAGKPGEQQQQAQPESPRWRLDGVREGLR